MRTARSWISCSIGRSSKATKVERVLLNTLAKPRVVLVRNLAPPATYLPSPPSDWTNLPLAWRPKAQFTLSLGQTPQGFVEQTNTASAESAIHVCMISLHHCHGLDSDERCVWD
jgi:hypothetical protein